MRSTSRDAQKTGASLAQTVGAAEVQKIRKELIQTKAAHSDLQEELEEKTKLYLDAIKARDDYKSRLNNAKDNINRVQDIVQQKVTLALENERKELTRLRQENASFKEKQGMQDNTIRQLQDEKKQLLDKIHGLNEDLGFYSRNVDARDTMKRIDILRSEKDGKEKKIAELLVEINNLSTYVEDFKAENRALRQMANVPDNYGIKLDQIKLHDKEKIDDFKKLIKVLQEDNFKLEEERAKLKHAIKIQSMMYKSTDPSERFKGLSQDQLMSVDQFVLRLLTGEASDPSDVYSLRRENESLKAQMEALNSKGFEQITQQVKLIFKDKKFDDNSHQLSKLISDNEELRLMIARLFEQGISPGAASSGQVVQGNSGYAIPVRNQLQSTQFRAPLPGQAYDNEIRDGTSFKFSGSILQVTDKEGHSGVGSSSIHEHAFLHLQLQECLELIKRKDENLTTQQNEIDSLYKRVRNYILTQDQLYKDFVRMERSYQKREEDLKAKFKANQDQVMEEQTKYKALEAALKTIQSSPDQVQHRIIELTKQNSILDVNLLRLTRKYQSLEEQEKLLRREFHNKDEDSAEKDLFIQQRINSLKEWKARAIQQLKFQHQKLRMAVPISEFQGASKQLELAKQRNNELVVRNAKLAKQISELQKKLRDNQEADEQLRHLQDLKDEIEEEHEIVKKRLEAFDPVFRWENQVFQKIALILKRAKVSPIQAFEEFDRSKDGNLQRNEFIQGLEMLKVYDLTSQELDVLWNSFDTDRSGLINYKEFARKLERYGVRSRSREETIIYQMIEAVQRSKVKSLNALFELIDKSGRGFISREDFSDIFQSLNLKIDQQELEKFMDNFWKDKDAGIDYQGFLRIFSRYQVRLSKEQNASAGPKLVTDDTVKLKKDVYTRISKALDQSGRTLAELFRKVDSDSSSNIGPEELYTMFKQMRFENISSSQAQAIFDSIDFDGDGSISLPEFTSDFKMVCATDTDELIRENRQKAQDSSKVNQYGGVSQISKGVSSEVQMQTKIDIMHARERQLQRKIETSNRILQNSEKSIHFLQTEVDQMEKQVNDFTVTNYELKERVIYLENELKSCIRKDAADTLEYQNQNLLTELTETRAGMLSYKNMTIVIAEQAKNLKLIHERKKDEHDNLMNALRDMQSEGVTQERLGKLYFIIMLSRWQEASVNKKYDLVLSEVKELRNELINANQLCIAKEVEHNEAETLLQKYQLDLEKMKQALSENKGVFITQNQVLEFNQIIQDMSDAKTDLEEAHMKLRTNFRQAQDQLDSAQAKAEHASNLLVQLQRSKPSELSDRLVEMSEKLQQIRLNEYRANRKAEESDERIKYLSNLLKNKTDAIVHLEEKTSKAESQMFKQEEEFRKRDIERQRQFFYINKFEDNEPRSFSAAKQQQQTSRALQNASQLSNMGDMKQRLDAQTIANMKAGQDVQANWTKGQASNDHSDRLQKLEKVIEELNLKLIQKDSQIQRFEQWQIGDKYLSQDEVLKDAISEHRAKTSSAQDKEHKEMMDAAYQTIKTLQDMLDVKNQAIRSKEDQVVKMRSQMAQQRELDASTIQQLRDQLSFTGNSTLAKMQEIVSKHEVAATVTNQKSQLNTSKHDRLSIKEFERQLQEKDHIIQQLRARTEGHRAEGDMMSRKRDERLEEISALKEELRREKARNDVGIITKRLEKVQKERKDQDETIKALNKAIDNFKEQMTKFSSEKVQLVEENEIVKKKEEFSVVSLRKEIEQLKNKLTLVESNRDKKQEELKELKIKIDQLETQLAKHKTDSKDIDGKYQAALDSLETERRNKAKLQAELNNYKEDAKIGGNVGGKMSYDQLLQRNQELEQDNKILECQKKTVVVYNKENSSFEYIGEPRPLDYSTELTSVQDMLQNLDKWIKQNPRLTVGSIFRSLDKGNFGELSEQQITAGFEKMGILLKPAELRLLKEKLDPRSVGYLKIEPLIRQLQGIPSQDFLLRPIQKLAMLVESRDLTRVQFRSLIDSNHSENLNLEQLQKTMAQVKSEDFVISTDETEQIFKHVAKVQKTVGVQMSVTKLIDQVYYALHAVIVERMKDGLRRSGKYIADLLLKHDANKDGFLTYLEIESLLLETQVAFKNSTFNEILINEIFDPQRKLSKVSYDMIKWYIGEQISGNGMQKQTISDGKTLDLLPSQEQKQKAAGIRGNLSATQFEICRGAARKITAHIAQLNDVLSTKDLNKEGFLQNEDIVQTINDRRVPDLQPSELQLLMQYCDRDERGFVVIPIFCSKVQDLTQETDAEVKMRRFAKTIGHQGVNLRAELSNFDARNGKLDKVQFKKAIKQLSVGMSDAEIEILFGVAEMDGLLDIKEFLNQVQISAKSKPLPSQNQSAVKPNSKVQSKVGATGTKLSNAENQSNGGAFESWEIEKKYKKNLEALKQEIEERNREIQLARKEVIDSNQRAQKIENEKRILEARLVDKNSKPPRQTQIESNNQGSLEEIQKLRDEIYHVQQVNQALNKTIQVDLKAEIGRLNQEKDFLEQKYKTSTEKLRQKTSEIQQLVGKPMDQLIRREEREELRQKQIEELQTENLELTKQLADLQEQKFKADERNLDLKFEKETFDLSYARLQKRITDLEQYKLQSNQMSAVIKNQYESEIEKIRDQTEQIKGDALSSKPGDTVKLRPQTSKTAQELEAVIESLKRVIEKQKVENDSLKRQNDRLSEQASKKSNEPALRQKVEQLERVVHSYEMQDVNMDEKDQTIRKLVFANKTLREDLAQEIERFNLLQDKFRDLLIKYNIASKENAKNQKNLFEVTTGAHMQKYENFLDEDGEFQQKKSLATQDPGDAFENHDDDLNDSLNKINKADSRGYKGKTH